MVSNPPRQSNLKPNKLIKAKVRFWWRRKIYLLKAGFQKHTCNLLELLDILQQKFNITTEKTNSTDGGKADLLEYTKAHKFECALTARAPYVRYSRFLH